MKFCRFQFQGRAEYGLIESLAGRDEITRLLVKAPDGGSDPEDLPSKAIPHSAIAEAALLVPVRPSKIVCVGRNYHAHAAELGNEVPREPLLFLKPPSSLLATGGNIRRPRISERTDYEGELGVVIGKPAFKLAPDEDVRPYILGYTAVNDFTARDLQKKDGQWTRAKGFDTFCAVGPIVSDETDPVAGLMLETRVNGELKQHGSTADFIFSIPELLVYISAAFTLEPGDLILTGTPAGVGPLAAGDRVEVSIAGLGVLRNDVAEP